MPALHSKLAVIAPQLLEIAIQGIRAANIPYNTSQGREYAFHMIAHCVRKHRPNLRMAHEKTRVKVLHRSLGVRRDMSEGLRD